MAEAGRGDAPRAVSVATAVSLSVVIPVYNEQAILDQTIEAIVGALRSEEAVSSFEVVISENGSTDGTRALARELAARHEQVVVLESDLADYGAAMRAGFLAASGSFLVNFDADYYDFGFVQQALQLDADIVVAAKGIAGSRDNRALLRRFITRGFGLLVRRLLDLRTTETHGMKLFRRAAVEPLLCEVKATKDLFDTELVARAERSGLTIAELPIKTEEMRHSRSAIYRRIPRTLWGLLKIWYRLRIARPAAPPRMWEACPPPPFLAGLQGAGAPFHSGLFVVGRGRVAVEGGEEALLCLDESGVAVLVVTLDAATAGTGSQIADELDRLAQLTAAQLSHGTVAEDGALVDGHAGFFGSSDAGHAPINHDQRAVVVVREPPSVETWEELLVELGGKLSGVYTDEAGELIPVGVPDELGRRRRPRRVRALAAATGLLLLAVVTVLLVPRISPPATPAVGVAASAVVRGVANGVPAAATHNQWIGQDRLVRTSEGRLLAVYGTDQGLQVVADQADHGRAWGPPEAVTEDPVVSSSVAIDDADRLHVVFSDGSRVAYAIVQERGGRWTTSRLVEVDGATLTPYVDIAYDQSAGVAHLVWVEEGADGQAPRWAVISGADDGRAVLQSARLAPPATDIPVLVNVAAGPGSLVVATFRRGDSPAGWFARTLRQPADGDLVWGQQEALPTDAGIGAADLAIDRWGIAHLVLRDSTEFELTYFRRQSGGGWGEGETAVDAETVDQIDFPSLTVDQSSRMVYLFFQSDRSHPETDVQLAVREPVGGWQMPRSAAPASEIPGGAFYPTSLAETVGAPIVLWTTGDAAAELQAAVMAP